MEQQTATPSQKPVVTVGSLIVAPDQTILLVRSHKWSNLFTFPGGKVDLGETMEKAVIREILEETGLKVQKVQFAQTQESIFSSEFWQKKHLVMHDFIAWIESNSEKSQVKLNEEAQEYRWVTLKEAKELPLTKETKLLVQWYEQNLT